MIGVGRVSMKRFFWFLVVLILFVPTAVLAANALEPHSWGDVLQYAVAILPALAAAVVVGIKNWPELIKSKTFWAGVSAIIAAVQQYMAGNIDAPTLIWAVLAGLAVIFLRDAQATATKAAEQATTDPTHR